MQEITSFRIILPSGPNKKILSGCGDGVSNLKTISSVNKELIEPVSVSNLEGPLSSISPPSIQTVNMGNNWTVTIGDQLVMVYGRFEVKIPTSATAGVMLVGTDVTELPS